VNLVAIVPDRATGEHACDTMDALGARHPGRTVVLVLDAQDDGGMDASVKLHAGAVDGIRLWSEDIILTVRGATRRHLSSVVEPLLLPDLPCALWFVATRPSPDDLLIDTADVILVDSKELGAVDCFPDLLQLARRRTVTDLCWLRLTPWRVLLAGMFEGRAYRPFLRGVRAVEVRGKPGPRDLLAGWLTARLRLPRSALHVADARHAWLRLSAQVDGTTAEFVTERHGEERVIRATARVEGGPSHEELLPLPDTSLPWSLARALSDLEGDWVYEEALAAALDLAA